MHVKDIKYDALLVLLAQLHSLTGSCPLRALKPLGVRVIESQFKSISRNTFITTEILSKSYPRTLSPK